MPERIIYLEKLIKGNTFKFYSDQNEIDFMNKVTGVQIFFDGRTKPDFEEQIQLYISNKKQQNTTVFEVPIEGYSAKIIISTNILDYDLYKIKIIEVERSLPLA